MTKLILDTHIILDSIKGNKKLNERIKKIINEAQLNKKLYISSITLWEIAMLIDKKRISVYEPTYNFLEKISNLQGLNVIDLSASVASQSIILKDFHGDPADKIIVASTKIVGGALITRDKKILNWSEGGYIKVMKG